MSEALLSVAGLSKRFGGLVAVNDLSFGLAEGDILGLIGPSKVPAPPTMGRITISTDSGMPNTALGWSENR